MIAEKFLPEKAADSNIDYAVGDAACALDNLWLQAKAHGWQKEFLSYHSEWIKSATLPAYLKRPRGYIFGKQQPSFGEAVEQTVKRLTFVEKFSQNLSEGVIGHILGGSMSYGRFYCIRGGDSPSDVDILSIVDPLFFSSKKGPSDLVHPSKGFKNEEADLFIERCANFVGLHESGQAQMMSQKFTVEDYVLSLKVIPFSKFIWEFNTVPQHLITDRSTTDVAIQDYKPGPYPDKSNLRNNFFQKTHVFNGQEKVLPSGEVITEVPVASFQGGTLYTGDHQNHVVPKLEVYSDTDGAVGKIIHRFGRLLRTEFDIESAIPNNGQKPLVVAISQRWPLFSAQVVKEAQERFAA